MAIPWAKNLFSPTQLFKKRVCNLALFCLATVLATFKKIGHFFPNHLVTLLGVYVPIVSLVMRGVIQSFRLEKNKLEKRQ